MPSRPGRWLPAALAVLAVVLVLLEGWARWSGVTDYPLYDADPRIGYLPKPSQAGTFARRYAWQFNELSMGTGTFAPTRATDVLLAGDSIVHGGIYYRQQDRLGPRLAEALGQAVWPVSATSWRLTNVLAYLTAHPDVVRRTDHLILVLNGGDFGPASSWRCNRFHPRSRAPLAAVQYLRQRAWQAEPCGATPPALAVPASDWRQDLQRFLAGEPARGKRVTVFLYPVRGEIGDPAARRALEAHAAAIARASPVPVEIHSVARDPRWSAALYRPDNIHPTAQGTKILAGIIAAPSPPTRLHPPPGTGPAPQDPTARNSPCRPSTPSPKSTSTKSPTPSTRPAASSSSASTCAEPAPR